jgi:hypothetical protein
LNGLKSLFHLTMACVAVGEFCQSKSLFRKQLCGAFFGFHLASAYIDIAYRDEDKCLRRK